MQGDSSLVAAQGMARGEGHQKRKHHSLAYALLLTHYGWNRDAQTGGGIARVNAIRPPLMIAARSDSAARNAASPGSTLQPPLTTPLASGSIKAFGMPGITVLNAVVHPWVAT